MPARKLREYLDSHEVRYITIIHSPAYAAQEIAHAAHIPGKELAKTVILKVDGDLVMAVVPAMYKVDLEAFRSAVGADVVALATEEEFENVFPTCELGAMPPFGNLWKMPVYVAEQLTEDDRIAFNAGSHTELVQMAYADFARLVKPKVVAIGHVYA